MKLIDSIRALLSRGTVRFNPLEMKILGCVISQLGPVEAEKLRRRIAQVNLVQRLDGGREVNSYQITKGRPAFDESTRLVDFPGEHALAKFSFKSSRDEPFSGKVWLVEGILFSLQFDNPTEHVIDEEIHGLSVRLSDALKRPQ